MAIDPMRQAMNAVMQCEMIKAELHQLIAENRWQKPTAEQLAHVKNLRTRLADQVALLGRLELREHAIELAIQQRLGRIDVEGEDIMPEDEARADELLALYEIGGA